jgi:hypothetical protein
MADVSAQLYQRAIAVMRGAEACGGFLSLNEDESYAVEYWPLEQYKLKLAPPEREFARQVVLVTGAAGGIGLAAAQAFAGEGARVVKSDHPERTVVSHRSGGYLSNSRWIISTRSFTRGHHSGWVIAYKSLLRIARATISPARRGSI